jgi:hypothetical protein
VRLEPTPRVAFVHVMKTAGSFVNGYLCQRVLRRRGYRLFNSWESLRRDWTPEELDRIRREQPKRAYVHNHAGGWDEDSVRRFQEAGWFAFSFVRHPGDRWCSFYHWAANRKVTQGQALDAFLRRAISGGFPRVSRDVDVPAFWQVLDFVEEFSPTSFARLLGDHFAHAFDPSAMPPVNVSGNPGYHRCLEQGLISEATDRMVRASAQFEVYEAIRARSLESASMTTRGSR